MVDATLQAVVFNTAFEGLGRRFRNELAPAVLAELRAQGLDFDRLQPAYPLETWEFTVRRVSSALYPHLATAEAWHRLGREFIDGYAQTMMGRSIVAVGKLLGTRRFMERLGRNLRTGGNFAQVSVREVGPSEVEVESRIDPAFLPQWRGKETVMHHYRIGVIEGALAALGAQPEVTLVRVDADAQLGLYRARWR